MPINTANHRYHVRTFEDMQIDLENYLKEDHLEDGTWTVTEKNRKINEGCIAVASHSIYPPTLWEKSVVNEGTPEDPLTFLSTPKDLIKPVRLFIDSFEYLEQTLDQFVRRKTGLINISEPTSTGLSAVTRINFDRFFWWDEARNAMVLNPPITTQLGIEFYYVPMPNLLVNIGDISTLHTSFTYLPSLWAAWKILSKDEEHRDRGLAAKNDFKDGLKELERMRNRIASNKIIHIKLDRNVFSRPRDFDIDGRVDLGSAFDRIP